MIVIVLEKVSPSLRGLLSRWLIEPKTGVFVGRVSTRVRELLWEKCLGKLSADSGAILLYPAPTEQGFAVRTGGGTSRELIDMEGLCLVRKPHREGTKAREGLKLGKEAREILRRRNDETDSPMEEKAILPSERGDGFDETE